VLLTAHRETEAARRLLKKAIRRHGGPEMITIDGRDAHEAAITRDHEAHGPHRISRQVHDCTNIVAQAHRAVKRVTRPMVGFQSFDAAPETRVGIARMPRLKTRPLVVEAGDEGLPAAALFDSLVA